MEKIKNIPSAKVLLLGDSTVGKTSIMMRFTDNDFQQSQISTVGVDFRKKQVKIGQFEMKLQIWDTAGQEKYRAIADQYYKDASGIILVFDLTNEGTFDNIRNWLRQIRSKAGDDICKIIVGNKSDLRDQAFDKSRIQEFIKDVGIYYLEVSAKDNSNIDEAFQYIAKAIKDKKYPHIHSNILTQSQNESNINNEINTKSGITITKRSNQKNKNKQIDADNSCSC